MFDVVVPATLSNLGPGFDVLGMALTIANRFSFTALADARYEAYGKKTSPKSHLALRTLLAAQRRFGGDLPNGIAVTQEEDVPRSRGLGSSATARVAGFVAYARFTGVRPPLDKVLEFISEAEGHPDNAVPAMVGGLTICAESKSGMQHMKLDVPSGLHVALCIPDRTVETAAAREVMPRQYTREDAVFNTSRIALLIAGLLSNRPEVLPTACDDRIHQPYRKPLIGPVDESLRAAMEAGASAAFISGSGSTLAAFVFDGEKTKDVAEAMRNVFVQAGVGCAAKTAEPARAGAYSSLIESAS